MFFLSVKVGYRQNVDTMQFETFLSLLYKNKPFEIITTAELIKNVGDFISFSMT